MAQVSGTSKAIDDSSASVSLTQLTKTANLAEANASEEEKIKAMMIQSCRAYDPINYMKNPSGPPPPSYTCFPRGKPGHYRKNCPANRVKNFEPVPRVKKSTGIPKSFLMEVKDPKTKGAMLTNTGKYVIPIINAEAYARGKKEKPHFLPEEPPSSSDDPIPDELLCLICKEIMTDAAVIPCCGNSYCDECIRTALLESEEHTCPTCHQTDVSPDALNANKFLRQAVNDFNNGTGYSKQIQQQQQLPPPPPPPALMRQKRTCNVQPLLRPKVSRQQDPLMVLLAPLASHSAAALSPLAPAQSSVAAGLPVTPSAVIASDLPPAASLSLHDEKPDGPFGDANVAIPAAAVVTAAGPSKSSSPSVSRLLEEKCSQVPVLGQPALPRLLGSQGHSISTTGHPMRASTICSAGGRAGWELSKSPCSGSSYSGTSHTCSRTRPDSSCTHSFSKSCSHSHSRSNSRSLPYPRRGKGKSHSYRSRSRSHSYYRSRSRSPPHRRYHSRSRSPPHRRYHSRSRCPIFRGQSPTKWILPQD
ncbi:E3 ubiquitin-protein ligase RBBP6-like [Nyctibius grandis]|uniref:E3 ubiquitin-protein ligase RBBP6-like n=1 Tax=Nyctibius grandis TaxID=48427 RepID=UPI0035BC7D29